MTQRFARRSAATSLRALAAIGLAGLACSAHAQVADYRAEFPTQYTESPMGVNLQTGKFRYQLYTFDMGPFQVQRGFGKSDFPYSVSLNWATLSGMTVIKVSLSQISHGSATNLVFLSTYQPWTAQTMGWSLSRSGTSYYLTDRSGNVYKLDDSGATQGGGTPASLNKITYADGSALDVILSGTKTFYRHSRGYGLLVEDTASDRKVCGFNLAQNYADANSSCASSTYKVTLAKNSSGNFTSVVDVMGRTSTISYTSTGRIQCMTRPDSPTCEFTNTYGDLPGEVPHAKSDQVRIQVDALGRQYQYDYQPPESGPDNPPVPGFPVWSYAQMVDPAGRLYGFSFDRGLLVHETTPQGDRVYSYPGKIYTGTINGTQPYSIDYHGNMPAYVQHPEGNLDYHLYNLRGQPVMVVKAPKGAAEPTSAVDGSYIFSSDPDLHDCCVSPDVPNTPAGAISYGSAYLPNYPANTFLVSGCGNGPADARLCDKPLAIIDPKGLQTDFTYDPAHGGVLTKTSPADPAGIRPQVRYEYAQRYAWVKNSAGAYVQSGSPIWLKVRERTCRTTAASGQSCAGGAADEVITDFDYGPNSGPNNLLLRGIAVTADGQTLRTCYSYDAQGRKISETQPNAGLAVCS